MYLGASTIKTEPFQHSSQVAVNDRGWWGNKIVGDWSPASATATIIGPAIGGAMIGYVVTGGKRNGALIGSVSGIIANFLLWRAVFSDMRNNPYMMYPG